MRSTGRVATLSWLLALTLAALLSSLFVPPFQSPDENEHFRRAAMVSRGQWVLVAPPGQSSGGWLDDGLERFIHLYDRLQHDGRARVVPAGTAAGEAITWTGTGRHVGSPGTGIYLPVVYMPQAAAIAVGRAAGWSVASTYRLARITALTVSIAALALAAALAPPLPPLAVVTLSLPMSVFQAGATSIDGICHGLAALGCALMALLAFGGRPATPVGWPTARPWSIALALTAVLAALIGARMHALPLALCAVLIGALRWRESRGVALMLAGGMAMVVALGWLMTVSPGIVDLREGPIAGPGLPKSYYVVRPMLTLNIVTATLLSDLPWQWFQQLIGSALGWLDTWMGWRFVGPLMALLVAVVGLSWLQRRRGDDLPAEAARAPGSAAVATAWRIGLPLAAVMSSGLVLFALLNGFTPAGSPVIMGVQGRYFIIPLILVAYGQLWCRWTPAIRIVLMTTVALSALACVVSLSDRYWTPRWSAVLP